MSRPNGGRVSTVETNGQRRSSKDQPKGKDVDETIKTIEISGIKSFMQARSIAAKIFWLVLLLTSTTILVWQLYKTVTNYIDSPIVSTYTITTVPEMAFPIVYICPTTLISSEFLNHTPSAEMTALELKEDMGVVWDYVKFLASGDLTQPFELDNIDRSSHVVPFAFKNMVNVKRTSNRTKSEAAGFWNASESHHNDPEAFFKNVTTTMFWSTRHCEFRSFLFEKMDCSNITREVFDPDYGKCYVVDVGSRKQAVQSQGLFLVFNVQSRWFPKDSPLTPLFKGIMVRVEREYNVKGSGEELFLTPSTYNRLDLAVQRQQFKSFDHPYTQRCTGEDEEEFEYEIFNVNYTQRSCAFDCVARALKEKCHCVPPVDRSLYKESVLNETSEFCMGEHLACINEKVHKDAKVVEGIEACRARCHVPCEDWRYDVRVSSMDLYKPAFEVGQPVPDITYMMVAFSHMEYTQFTQDDSTTVDEFIANIGGEIGLWLGASMMTLIQLPLSFITLCGLCCVKKAKMTADTVRRKSMAPGAFNK